ncbi:MAG: hypothetical protein J0I20_08245 [Chloroflexi bacterium]|nr:hypothetical protein [Chloroflexota bacterium]OJV97132.1 MAG: hypothetical protein BGO39_19290 [Chloroflexi bacterium 54-19]
MTFSKSYTGQYFSQTKFNFWLAVLLVAGLTLAAFSAVPTQAAFPTVGTGFDSPFGMNVMGASRYMANGGGDDYSLPYQQAKDMGVGWTREEIGWNRVEPKPGQWNFGFADKAVNAALSRNIQVLGLLEYNVSRDGAGNASISYSMPDLNAWANYVRQTVSHFKGKVNYWQIWNEPQDPRYFASADPGQYAQLLAVSYDTIKSIDPNIKVLCAGFVPVGNGLDWMDAMIAAGGRDKFDILAIHPYVNDPTPNTPNGSMSPERGYWLSAGMNLAQGLAARLGNRPIWATEFGFNLTDTDPGRYNQVTADQQANYIVRTYAMGLSTNVQKFFVYQFHDDTSNPRDQYGLVGTDWKSHKPSYNAYASMVARLTGATPLGQVDPYEGTNSYATLFNFDNAGAGTSCQATQPNNGYWNCYASSSASVTMSYTSDQARSGQALKVDYNLTNTSRDRYVSLIPPSFPALNFAPKKIGFWAMGDATQTEMHLHVIDANNVRYVYTIGRMGAPSQGWQRYEAQLSTPNVPAGPVSPAMPLKGMELVLDGWPKSTTYSGTAYFDDFYAEDSLPLEMYRFAKNGQNVDVVWADGASGTVNIPTASGSAKVYSRDGQQSTVNAQNGMLSIQVSDAPTYIEHQAPPKAAPPAPTNNNGSCASSGAPNLRASFQPTWDKFDSAITSGLTKRSWMWGPTNYRYVQEPYDEAPGGCRTVLYWDKSRMEITNPNDNPTDKYYVTNGLLARELVSGQIQVGNNHVVPASQGPAQIPAAGDSGNNPNTPTYAAFARVTTLNNDNGQPDRTGQTVIDTIDRNGNTSTNGSLAGYNVHLTNYVGTTQHNIADVFWSFMNSQGPIKINGSFIQGDAVDWIYSIGLPLSNPYWARVTVGGVEKDVLIQVFERRVLTYTPSNPDGFKVEMGNIGAHYATWRYGSAN